MLRRTFFLAAVALLAACSDCNTKCTEGITFYVSDVAGTLSPGTKEQLKICFDTTCRQVEISRSNAGGSVFVPFKGVAKSGDHHITLTGPASLSGDYTGPIEAITQNASSSCGHCALGTVKVGADGTLTPGSAVPNTTLVTTTSGG